jgi:ABC-type multidrug transport system ATPase subunit
VIDLHAAHTRTGPVTIAPLTLRLEAGTHALVGGTNDGVSLVLAICAGRLPLRSGTRRLLDGRDDDPRVRAAIAHVPLDAALPEPMRVDDVLRVAASIRGEPAGDAKARLDSLGVGALATRAVRSLSREEKRAVALAEAVTSKARLILVDEPLASIDPRAAALASEALRGRARDGACVVVATGSIRDARTIADDVLTFDRGALVRRAPASDPLVLAGPRGACVRVVASDTKRLAAALAGEEAVRDVSFEASVLVARGADAVAIAAALARAAARSEVTLESLVPDLLHDDELRAAIAGDAAGAYRAAFERARGPIGSPA